MSIDRLPPELLHRIISFLDTEDIPPLLSALSSHALCLFQLVKNHSDEPFLFKSESITPIKLRNFCPARHRALITLVELNLSLGQLDIGHINRTFAQKTCFFGITCADEDGDLDGGVTTQVMVKYLKRSKFLIMNSSMMSLVLRDVCDASRIHIRDTELLILHTSNKPDAFISWDNITSLDLNVNYSEYLQLLDLSNEPRERLQVTKDRGATSPLKIENMTIGAEYIVQFISCYHLQGITFPKARYLILLYPVFGKERSAPLIKNVEAPNLEALYFYSEGMLPEMDNFHAPQLNQVIHNGRRYDLKYGEGVLCPLYEMVTGKR